MRTKKNGNPHSSEFPSAVSLNKSGSAVAFHHAALAKDESAVRHRLDGPSFVERRDLAVIDALAHQNERVAALFPLFDAKRRHVHGASAAVEQELEALPKRSALRRLQPPARDRAGFFRRGGSQPLLAVR